jgi:type IX secretion system PorP/SprF family membrane protein
MIPGFAAVWFTSLNTSAQHSPVYDKHYNYEQFVNPAITGRDPYPYVNLANKKSFVGTDHSPNSTSLGGSFRWGFLNFYTHDMMLNKGQVLSKNRMGFGALILYEQNGPLAQLYLSGTYAYHIPFNRSQTSELSFGLSGQLRHYHINENLLDPADPGDPELMDLRGMPAKFDAGFGLYYHTKQFHVGASANELFGTESPIDNAEFVNNRADFFFQSGYKFYLRRFDLEPSGFLAIIDEEPLYYYTQLRVYYLNYNWLSLAYKSVKSITIAVGVRIGRMHLAYGYEQSVSEFSSFYSGWHELMLGLNIGLFEPEGLKKTVRK